MEKIKKRPGESVRLSRYLTFDGPDRSVSISVTIKNLADGQVAGPQSLSVYLSNEFKTPNLSMTLVNEGDPYFGDLDSITIPVFVKNLSPLYNHQSLSVVLKLSNGLTRTANLGALVPGQSQTLNFKLLKSEVFDQSLVPPGGLDFRTAQVRALENNNPFEKSSKLDFMIYSRKPELNEFLGLSIGTGIDDANGNPWQNRPLLTFSRSAGIEIRAKFKNVTEAALPALMFWERCDLHFYKTLDVDNGYSPGDSKREVLNSPIAPNETEIQTYRWRLSDYDTRGYIRGAVFCVPFLFGTVNHIGGWAGAHFLLEQEPEVPTPTPTPTPTAPDSGPSTECFSDYFGTRAECLDWIGANRPDQGWTCVVGDYNRKFACPPGATP